MKNIYIIGPTASGKTRLAIELSKILKIDIYNCDSRQSWKNIPLLTCSPTELEKREANHFLFNYLENDEKPSLGRWIEDLPLKIPKIIVGGTNFYIYALLKGIPKVNISQDTIDKSNSIENKYEFLQKSLREKFPSYLKINDIYRINRLTEFYLETNCLFDDFKDKYQEDGIVFYINPTKELLENNIKNRIENNILNWLEEVKKNQHNNFRTIIGYEESLDYLNNKINFNLLKEKIYKNTLKYVKKQQKFIKKINNKIEFNLNSKEDFQKMVEFFLNSY